MKKCLAILMALLAILLCGCSKQGLVTSLEERFSLDPAAALRQDLVEYRCGDLCFYLSDEFEPVKDYGGYVEYATEELTVAVSGCKVSGGYYDISDAKDFAQLYIQSEEPRWALGTYTHELVQAYGTWYVHAEVERDGQAPKTYVTGFYVEDGYGWFISVEGSNCSERLTDMIHYAALGQVRPEG